MPACGAHELISLSAPLQLMGSRWTAEMRRLRGPSSLSLVGQLAHRVGCKFYVTKKRTDWLTTLLHSRFYGSCDDHRGFRKNDKNVFCIDCGIICCRHCFSSSDHWLHRRLQICKYVYQDVIRFHDLHKHLDCSKIQTYKINGEKAVHLNPRPQSKDLKLKPFRVKSGTSCEACGRYIQDHPNCFCSIACKMSVESKGQGHDNVSIPIPEYSSDLSLKEMESPSTSTPTSTSTSEEETPLSLTFVGCALRPTKQMHKRKGIPRRAPLC